MPNIDNVQLTPPVVYCGNQFVISVSITDPLTWLLDKNDVFLIDINGVYLLEGGDG